MVQKIEMEKVRTSAPGRRGPMDRSTTRAAYGAHREGPGWGKQKHVSIPDFAEKEKAEPWMVRLGWCTEVSASGSETVSRRTRVCAHATHPEDGNGESHSECDYKEEPLPRQAQERFRGRIPLTSSAGWAKLSIDAIHDASFGLLLRMLYVLRRPCAVYVTRSSIFRTIFASPKPTA